MHHIRLLEFLHTRVGSVYRHGSLYVFTLNLTELSSFVILGIGTPVGAYVSEADRPNADRQRIANRMGGV